MANAKHASYFYAIFGITLVLLVIGTAAVMLIEAHRISSDFKENLKVEVQLSDTVSSARIAPLQKLLIEKPYVKSAKYISKDDALKILKKDHPEIATDLI